MKAYIHFNNIVQVGVAYTFKSCSTPNHKCCTKLSMSPLVQRHWWTNTIFHNIPALMNNYRRAFELLINVQMIFARFSLTSSSINLCLYIQQEPVSLLNTTLHSNVVAKPTKISADAGILWECLWIGFILNSSIQAPNQL